MDDKGNIWNVLKVESDQKGAHCWYQLMQLRDERGHRKYDHLIRGHPGQTLKSAQRKLINRYYKDSFKRVKYDAINNEIKRIIE